MFLVEYDSNSILVWLFKSIRTSRPLLSIPFQHAHMILFITDSLQFKDLVLLFSMIVFLMDQYENKNWKWLWFLLNVKSYRLASTVTKFDQWFLMFDRRIRKKRTVVFFRVLLICCNNDEIVKHKHESYAHWLFARFILYSDRIEILIH